MRAILDESLPRPLALEIRGHEVKTVRQMGWASLSNGELLSRLQEDGIGVLVTADRSIEHQQNLVRYGIGLVVLRAPSNRMEHLLPLVGQAAEAIANVAPGQVVHVPARGPGRHPRRRRDGQRR